MPSDALLKLREELLSAKAVMLPQIEGLADFARLNIKEATKQKVQATHANFSQRVKLIDAALAALDAVNADGFPDVLNVMVEREIYDDLQDNVNTIAAAFSKFVGERASDLGVVVGSPEPKP